MKLTVEIIRRGKMDEQPGRLFAYVVQEGQWSKINLLRNRVVKSVEYAHLEITQQLPGHELTIIDPPPIEEPLAPIKSGRQNYGMSDVRGYKNNAR